MSKLQDIRNLVQEHAVSVSSSPGDWMDYMDTASRLYRYSFSDQLLIHAQRPDATACASLELWNEPRGGKRCSCQSAGMDAVPKHCIQTVQIHFSRTAFNLCTATGSNCRSIHGNLESEDVPLDQKGIQGDCPD